MVVKFCKFLRKMLLNLDLCLFIILVLYYIGLHLCLLSPFTKIVHYYSSRSKILKQTTDLNLNFTTTESCKDIDCLDLF